MAEFDKGDIVSVHFPFTDGTEAKRRPALVIYPTSPNSGDDILLMQITSKHREDGFSILLAHHELNPPLPLSSFVRLHKLFTLDKKLVIQTLSHLEKAKYDQVIEALFELLR